MNRKPSCIASQHKLRRVGKSVFWDAFRSQIWFRRLLAAYFFLLIAQATNVHCWHLRYMLYWDPIFISTLFFVAFLCCIGFQQKNTAFYKPITWPAVDELSKPSLFFAGYLVLSPLIMQTLAVLNWNVCQSIWHQVLISWAFFVLFLSSPIYDLVFYLAKLPTGVKRSFFRNEITFSKLLLSGNDQTALSIKDFNTVLNIFEQRVGSWLPLSVMLLALIVGTIVNVIVSICAANSLTHALQLVLIVPTIFPVIAAGMVFIDRRLEKRLGSGVFEKGFKHWLLYELPIISIFLACVAGISMFTFWPLGTGGNIAEWLTCSFRDANILPHTAIPQLAISSIRNANSTTGSGAEQELIYGVSIVLWLVLYRIFVPLAWRLGAFYQFFLQKLVLRPSNHGLSEAITDAISLPRKKMSIRPQHPHWRSVKESIQYISLCYVILFCLVAFCPGSLGQTITNWLNASIKSADPVVLRIGQVQHPSMPYYPGMTQVFQIGWTDSSHGIYESRPRESSEYKSNKFLVDEHGTYAIKDSIGLNTYVADKRMPNVRNQAPWEMIYSFGRVLWNIPAWICNLNDPTTSHMFLGSLIAAEDQYNRAYRLRYYSPEVIKSVWRHMYLSPSAPYAKDEPDIPVEVVEHGASRWQLPYLVGKDLSNSMHWNFRLGDHFNLKLFLASVVAALGTAPFAIMSCAFLPLRRPDEVFVSEQGFLQPNKLIGIPLFLWSDLRQVSLLNTKSSDGSCHVLKLVFRPGGTIKIRLNTISRENLSEVLAMMDEYSTNCFFDNKVIRLRRELLKENLSSTTAAYKFESTIFQPLIAGDRLDEGRLRIIRKLASKPLSAVYLARNEQSKLVVVKQFVTPNNNAIAERYKEMFRREQKLISSLNHPMMAKFIDGFDENGSTYLVIEHIAGENLRTFIERHGARSEKVVVNWAQKICQFMQYLHGQNPPLLHRDLTPDNIMLAHDGQIRIIDFGAAHQFMEGVTGTLIGKQCYIAPEQLRGKANRQSDIYSFGCTIYFLLTGKDPRALSQSDLAQANISVSHLMQDLIKDCTEFDDDKRPKSFREVMAALDSIASSDSISSSTYPLQLLNKLGSICTNFPDKFKELMP